MNRMRAFYYLDKNWYKEIYKVHYDPPLTDSEKDMLSDYIDKKALQKHLEDLGVNLYQTKKGSLKEALEFIKNA